jgi:hypothetical protein
MLNQTPSQILKAEFRGKIQTEFHHCFSVFNYLDFYDSSRLPFGNLLVFNEEIIAANQTVNYSVLENQVIVILPLVGALDIETESFSGFVHTNQLEAFFINANQNFTLSNPYEDENVQFLQVRIQVNSFENQKKSFEISTKNKINTLLENDIFKLSIAVFDARKEAEYLLQKTQNGVFAFVLNGAFEFQNRLLENRDGIKIWNIDTLEMEALSNEAMILIIELQN